MPFCGDRVENRVLSLARHEGMAPKFVDLGFSWLASHEDCVAETGGDRRIKARPEWGNISDRADLVVVEDALLACDIFLRAGDIGVSLRAVDGRQGLLPHLRELSAPRGGQLVGREAGSGGARGVEHP